MQMFKLSNRLYSTVQKSALELRRDQYQQMLQYYQQIVAKANSITSANQLFLTAAPFYEQKIANGSLVKIVPYLNSTQLPIHDKEFVFQLTKNNMSAAYAQACERAKRGNNKVQWNAWNDAEKQKELFSSKMRFLLCYDQQQACVAFACFQFDMEEDAPVVYLYEIQVSEAWRKHRLGSMLLTLVELAGKKFGLHKVQKK